MKPLEAKALVAPCGLNCSVCAAFLREKNRCTGCRAADGLKPAGRWQCKVKACPLFRGSHFSFCFRCASFPCAVLNRLDKRYRTRYRVSVIDNLNAIKKDGIRRFVAGERIRWACSGCGGTICMHKGRCQACGRRGAQ